ncbi:hypothetical protein [Nonomuraea sp. NPDC050783]|uniref:hypothetical protein n=1 Tax=Nonomuraea sp. NPDC050783 TaxID=3154634 RepID=UPI0034663606
MDDGVGRHLLEGLVILNDLSQRGVAVKVREGIVGDEHTECEQGEFIRPSPSAAGVVSVRCPVAQASHRPFAVGRLST